jgi:hypothetical protein
MTYHITFIRFVWKTTILLYVPGEIRMDPKTEVCLYPCGGAPFAPMARGGIRLAVWSTLDSCRQHFTHMLNGLVFFGFHAP